MIKFLKKLMPCSFPHSKSVGKSYPESMVEIFRFSPYKTDRFGYGIHECAGCRKRFFSCLGYHMMGPDAENTIDSFIAHKITREEFIKFLEEKMNWFKEIGKLPPDEGVEAIETALKS